MRGFSRFVVRNRLGVLAFVGIATVVLLMGSGRLAVVINPDELLPQSHPYIRANNFAERAFGHKYPIVIGLTPKTGDALQPAVLRAVSEITTQLRGDPAAIRGNVLSLAAPKAKEISGAPDGIAVKRLLGQPDPSAEHRAWLRRVLADDPLYKGLLISNDMRTTVIVAEFRDDPAGFRAILNRVEAIVAPYRTPDLRIAVAGHTVYLGLTERFSDRMKFLFPLALLVIGLVHFEAFRSLQGLFLPLVTGLVAVVWTLGVMGWAGVPLDPFNATTPILILAVGAGHAVQVLKRYYEEYRHAAARGLAPRRANDEAIVEAVGAVGPVMVAAGLTAAASFASLCVFEMDTIRTFGIMAALGILSTLVVELTLIPALRAILPPPGVRQVTQETRDTAWRRLALKLADLSVRHPGAVVLSSLAVFGGLLVCTGMMKVNNSERSYFLSSLPARQDDAYLNRRMAGNNLLYVVVRGDKPDAIKSPAVLKAMAQTQAFLDKDPEVGRTLSIVDFLRRIDAAIGNQPVGHLPRTAEQAAQYLLLYSMSGEPNDFDAYIDYSYRDAVITAYLKEESSPYLQGLVDRLETFMAGRFPPGIHIGLGGTVLTPVALNDALVRTKLLNMGQIALCVFAIASILFRTLLGGLFVLIPLVLSVVANFALMGLTGIPLQVATVTVSAMAVGIGADYAIYFLYRLREESAKAATLQDAVRETFASSGKAIMFVATAVAAGYAILLLSWGFLIHFWLGLLIGMAMITSAAATLTTLSAAAIWLRPRFIFGPLAARTRTSLAAGLALLVVASGAHRAVAAPTADEIMQRNFVATKVADSIADATFTLINADGEQRVRKTLTMTKLEDNGIDNMRVVRFLAPPDVRGTATLTVEHSAGDDDIWIYLPALRKTRRLLASNKKDAFVGTDFSYGDMIGFKVAEWRHTLLRQEPVDGKPCYVVESVPATPKAADDSGYSRRVQWIRADGFVTVKGEYYDRSGKLLKTFRATDVRQVDAKADRWQAMRSEVKNDQTGHSTVIQLDNFKANQGLPARTFTARGLERAQ